MLVQNETKIPAFTPNDSPQPLKEGGSYHATVKERLPNNEALVQVKGQEMRVKVDGNIPDSNKTTMQINDMKHNPPVVKLTPAEAGPVKPSGPALSDEMKQAVKLLNEQNIPITKETLQNIKTFMEKGSGTTEQKLETLARMAAKKLDFTPQQMKAVNEALHGPSLGQSLHDIAKALDPAYKMPSGGRQPDPSQAKLAQILSQLEKVVNSPEKLALLNELAKALQQGERAGNVAKMIASEFSAELKSDPALARALASVLKESAQLVTGSATIESKPVTSSQSILQQAVQSALKQVKTVPDLDKVLGALRNQDGLQTLPAGQQAKWDEAVSKAEQMQAAGRELAARQELAAGLAELAEKPAAPLAQPQEEAAYRLNSDLLTAIPVQSRDLVVTTITKKLSQAAIDFTNVKRDISQALQTAQMLIKQAPMQARPSLEAAIKSLDNAILKSDFMLYTDMGTEKKLLQASGQLHEARKLLASGEFSKASELVHQVRTSVDKLIFQPSDVRVKHFVSKEMMQLESTPLANKLTQTFEEPLNLIRQEPTARHALEYLRNLGLTHERDFAFRLIGGEKAETDASLKQMLMKLAQAEAHTAVGQRAEQALQNMTGQQLLSKSDPSGLQSMMFSLPIMLQDQVDNVKVFLNSKKSGEKIDWENCSLYFLLETKKLGDVGILLNAVDRTLSLTIKNDREDFKEKIEPLAQVAKTKLEEIGYNIGTMQFTALTAGEDGQEPTKKRVEPRPSPAFRDGGYDFSI